MTGSAERPAPAHRSRQSSSESTEPRRGDVVPGQCRPGFRTDREHAHARRTGQRLLGTEDDQVELPIVDSERLRPYGGHGIHHHEGASGAGQPGDSGQVVDHPGGRLGVDEADHVKRAGARPMPLRPPRAARRGRRGRPGPSPRSRPRRAIRRKLRHKVH